MKNSLLSLSPSCMVYLPHALTVLILASVQTVIFNIQTVNACNDQWFALVLWSFSLVLLLNSREP